MRDDINVDRIHNFTTENGAVANHMFFSPFKEGRNEERLDESKTRKPNSKPCMSETKRRTQSFIYQEENDVPSNYSSISINGNRYEQKEAKLDTSSHKLKLNRTKSNETSGMKRSTKISRENPYKMSFKLNNS